MNKEDKKAVYAFSGDPITYGHINIIKRAANLFDEVLVSIGSNPDKNYMFSLDERLDMANNSLIDINNVAVNSFNGLLVDYAYEKGANVIVKGIRNMQDFEYENNLFQLGESQDLGIETVILFTEPELARVSSSAAKAILKEYGFIHKFVPLYVKQNLEAKMNKQYIIGITGEIGTGKSYISKEFENLGKKKGINVHNLELDQITHQILSDQLNDFAYVNAREKIIEEFGANVGNINGSINRKELGEIVFNDKKKLDRLNEIMRRPLEIRIKKELNGKEGLILFNAALIAESNMNYLCNNNVVLVERDKKTQEKRLKQRNLTKEQIKRRLSSQYTYQQKDEKIQDEINEHNQGYILRVDNSNKGNQIQIEETFDEIINKMNKLNLV